MPWLTLLGPILQLLKQAGIIKDPQQEADLQKALSDAAAQADKSFADFIAATQPQGTVVAGVPWFINLFGAVQNFVVALVRPGITVVAAWYIYPHLQNGSQVPVYAWIPIMFWFTGRTVEKLMGSEGFPVSDFNPAPAPALKPPSRPTPPPQPSSVEWTSGGGVS